MASTVDKAQKYIEKNNSKLDDDEQALLCKTVDEFYCKKAIFFHQKGFNSS